MKTYEKRGTRKSAGKLVEPEGPEMYSKEWFEEGDKERAEKMHEELAKAARGFHSSDIHKAAEELRMEGKGNQDPHYSNSKKNK